MMFIDFLTFFIFGSLSCSDLTNLVFVLGGIAGGGAKKVLSGPIKVLFILILWMTSSSFDKEDLLLKATDIFL